MFYCFLLTLIPLLALMSLLDCTAAAAACWCRWCCCYCGICYRLLALPRLPLTLLQLPTALLQWLCHPARLATTAPQCCSTSAHIPVLKVPAVGLPLSRNTTAQLDTNCVQFANSYRCEHDTPGWCHG